MTSIKKQDNNINNIYFLLEKKIKSSKINTVQDKDNDTNLSYLDNFEVFDINSYLNNKNGMNIINNITNKKGILKNNKYDSNYDTTLFITDYSNKRNLKLNQDKFNQFIRIDKKNKKKIGSSYQKRNNSMTYKKTYLAFNSKYPFTETFGLENLDDSYNEYKKTKPTTERENKRSFRPLFKKKFNKKFTISNKKTKNIKKIRDIPNKQDKKENKIYNTLDDQKVTIKKNKKEVSKDKIEVKKNLSVKKNDKEHNKIKEKKIFTIKNIKRIKFKINKKNKNKNNKSKNLDLLKIKENYLSPSIDKDNYIEESQIKKIPNNIINLKTLSNFNVNEGDINNISIESAKEEEISEETDKNKNPKKLGLLVGHIKKILNMLKKKEEMKKNYLKEISLKQSYDLFKEQLDIANNIKIKKIKRLFSEMHSSKKEGHQEKMKFFDLLRLKSDNSFEEKNESISIKNDEEEKNKKLEAKEKNKILVEEMNLVNEIKFYMSTMDDPESYKKFENLLKQIKQYRKLNDRDYIKRIKENFGNFKEEIEDIFRSKEIEERINGFMNNLDKEINSFEGKRTVLESLINVVDHKFKSIIEN